MENEVYTMEENDSIYNQFFAGDDEYKHVIKDDHGPDGDTNIYLKNGKHVAYEEFIEKKIANDKILLQKKRSREEVAYDEFMEEILKQAVLQDPDLSEADVEELRSEFQDNDLKLPIMQALNAFLWKQDEAQTAAIRETYTNLQDLIKKTIPEDDRGEETGKILQLIDELVEAEDTEEELLSADELRELAGPDDDEEVTL